MRLALSAGTRRTLVTVVVGVLALGTLGGGVAAAKQQHDDKVRKERIAAEKKAAAAYVAAVRPLADRVFDAVQPIEDAIGAFSDIRPGLFQAMRDVVTKGGAAAELVVVREDLSARAVPATHRVAATHLRTAISDLSKAVAAVDHAVRVRASDGSCEACAAEDQLRVAETSWASALGDLGATPPLSAPGPEGGNRQGPARATRGGFIHASDLACSRAQVALGSLQNLGDVENVRTNFPREAKILRSNLAALSKVKVPAGRAALAQRLKVDLRSLAALAATLDKLSAALKAGDVSRYTSAEALLDTELDGLDKLGSTYQSLGASACAALFGTPEKKSTKAPLRA